MTQPTMRRLISIAEDKALTYHVVRVQQPGSSTVTDQTRIQAVSRQSLRQQVHAWMQQLGMDPDDEDDQALIRITAG